jgi:hypothetical protein
LRVFHNGLVAIGKLSAAVAAVAMVLAGCTADPFSARNVITATDRHRLTVMKDDPAFGTAVPGTRYDVTGELESHDNWRRGQANATIYQVTSPTDTLSPLPVQAFVRRLLTGMRSRGWVIYYATCNFDSLKPGIPPGVLDGPTEWYDHVYAYRIDHGVSYWADIATDANTNDDPFVHTGYATDITLQMIVPAASEPANLFPDRPAGLPIGSVCAASASSPVKPLTEGRAIIVLPQSNDPDPPARGATDR